MFTSLAYQRRIARDLGRLGVFPRSELVFKDYSKTMWGNYDPNTDRIVVYLYQNKDCTVPISYERILRTVVHEYVHSIEWKSSKWKRVKGVMHDAIFWRIYNSIISSLESEGILRERPA